MAVLSKDPINLIEPLILGRPLQNSLHDALQFVNGGGLFGIGEDGRLMTSNHKKHILEEEQQTEDVSSSPAWGGTLANTQLDVQAGAQQSPQDKMRTHDMKLIQHIWSFRSTLGKRLCLKQLWKVESGHLNNSTKSRVTIC